ncbi:MAG TPA: HAMP domain-containing sensor histidine kinase [Polyangia bacterium]|nr:HAMP domain-containing sensor histidine kinase [Polyangia bacterium]
MRIRRPIGHGLLMVAVLGVVTSGLAVLAMYRTIAVSNTLRLEHARDSNTEELARLTTATRDADAPPPNIIGMRGGVAADPAAVGARVPTTWSAPMIALALRAQQQQQTRADQEVIILGARLLASVQAIAGGRLAWVATAVRPSPYLQSWRILVAALTVSAMLLVTIALISLVTLKRGAGSLQAATRALASDLHAPVPRPPVRELADIGDGIATLARHLAESRQAQERMSRDLARQERLAALGRVVAGVAHEVRNPLASIKLRLDLAASPPSVGGGAATTPLLSPKTAAAIAHASAEIARLDGLVADLLTLSGRALGRRAPVDLGALARRRAEALAPWAALRQVTVRVSDEASGGAVTSGDANRLARAVDNLLRNAVEASPDGAAVDVSVSVDGDRVRLRVVDHGAGFPAGRAGELFEPFFTTKPDGTGLGLAISRAIAQAHDGELAYGRDGVVTRFDLTLPRNGAADAAQVRVGA